MLLSSSFATIMSLAVMATLAPAAAAPTTIVLEDFAHPQHEWREMNDPVMGGKSTGTFTIQNQVGHLSGHVAIVPFLQAPGFVKVETTTTSETVWPDISACQGLQLIVTSTTRDYAGYRLSFGHHRPPNAFPYIYGYKTHFTLESTTATTNDEEPQVIQLPFESFSDDWDAGTGDVLVTCSENPEYCPDWATKQNLYSIALWGEGVEGDVDLQVSRMEAYGCYATSTTTSEETEEPPTKDTTSMEENQETTSEETSTTSPSADEIILEDFSLTTPLHEWGTMNDPVMGGKSHSAFAVVNHQDGGYGQFVGTCAIVPFLHAPGFVTLNAGGGLFQRKTTFPNVATCQALKLVARSRVDYEGYYWSFGTVHVPGGKHASGYKTPLPLLATSSNDWIEVVVPFSEFSSKWDEKTGHIQVTCAEDPQYCPDAKTLQNMKRMTLWGEGVEGNVNLEIQSISAIQCASGMTALEQPAQLRETNNNFGSGGSWMILSLVAGVMAVVWTRRRRRQSRHHDTTTDGTASGAYSFVPEIQLPETPPKSSLCHGQGDLV